MTGLNLKLILEAVDRITGPIRNIKTKLVETFKSATDGAKKLAEQMDKAGKKAAEVGGFMTTRFSLPILGIGALSLRAAGQVEELTMQMEHLAGGAENAQKFVKSLQGYIDKFGTDELGKSVQLLETAGYGMDKIKGRLAVLGDVAAGSRAPLSQLTEQYIELRKAGKASDGDLDTMMKANIPIVAELAKQMHKSEKQIWNMAAAGKISFDQYRKAMEGLTEEGGRFNGAMERQGQSINGVFKELRNSIGGVMAELGAGLWKDLDIAPKIRAISDAVRSLAEGFMTLPKWLKNSITWLVLILAAIGPIVLIVGQFTTGIAGLVFAFSKLPLVWGGVASAAGLLVKTFKLLTNGVILVVQILPKLATGIRAIGLAVAANPLGLFLTVVAAVGVAAYLLIKNWSKVSAFFTGLWGSIKAVFKENIAAVLEYLQPLIDAVSMVVGGLARIGKGVGARIGNAVRSITGDEGSASGRVTMGAVLPAPRDGRGSKVDAGGTIKISIDQDNRARVVEARSNDRRLSYQAPDTGAMAWGS